MLEPNETALLPEGLHDSLVGDAMQETKVVENLLNSFSSNGYDLVLPPMVEFEESLLLGPGKAHSRNMFRLLDPASQRMMGVRTDMTGQVARISHSRLKNAPRPLRLGYAGDVLRIKGTQLRPERQFKQAGVELIGSDSTEAYVEIIMLAYDALKAAGAKKLSIDLAMPMLVPAITDGLGLDDATSKLVRHALDAKDIGELSNIQDEIGEISRALLGAAGPAEKALDAIGVLSLPVAAKSIVDELVKLVEKLSNVAPDLVVTIDPGEYTGFEYQTGISFSFFAGGVRGELGRGGRYIVNAERGEGEPATGFSLYLDSLIRAIGEYKGAEKIYIPLGTDRAILNELQNKNYRTIQGLTETDDTVSEAKRMGCECVWLDGQIENIS
ncbi:ATP phosphoribosyltransferase regulatory subunit [Pseudemcibacter aquimaris]|uniref:ATP phosphoribosyltransferase regulatory subunit n=1 Tax=Pseudemcibacter aquimaris TaxID=2857064 RepID=UPI0020127E8C|nr:ATP phosphoribosyltransferase regulatory subunit [Pseudemcibacter aquimaris]MCC3862199.1 ATP phosphoribosyltransferase regulatory subunit [Pseudemcibacter aquimaris]WDU58952.1 ATP phosphoribosyltransferase regulatory subunit [Pseudemcibacter aquimaris]